MSNRFKALLGIVVGLLISLLLINYVWIDSPQPEKPVPELGQPAVPASLPLDSVDEPAAG